MIKVCEHCSNVKIEKLEAIVTEENIEVGCIENCAAYAKESYGYINDELVVASTEEEFLAIVKERI